MYLDISLQLKKNCIIYLTGIVEVNSPKRKVWIMGVCDLDYCFGRADICLYLPHWNLQPNVSLF
jgi:hypothetical protein